MARSPSPSTPPSCTSSPRNRWGAATLPEPLWRIFFLNTGDGDAIYIEQADGGFNLLVDGGLADPTVGGRYPYRLSAAAFLRQRGVQRLDILAASHFHADHIGGLAQVAENLTVGEFWHGCLPDAALLAAGISARPHWCREAGMMADALGTCRSLVTMLQARGIPWRQLTAGDDFRCAGGACRIACLYPDAAAAADYDTLLRRLAGRPDEADLAAAMLKMNAVSLTLAVSLNGWRLLLPADLPATVFGPRAAGMCDLLKLAHHGAADAVDEELLARLRPRQVVISAAHDSPEFPHPSTRTLLARLDCRVHYTDTEKRPYLEFAVTERGCEPVGGR